MFRSCSKLVTDPGKESRLLDPQTPCAYHQIPFSLHTRAGQPHKKRNYWFRWLSSGCYQFSSAVNLVYVHWVQVLKFNHFIDTSKNSLKANLSKTMSWYIRRLLTISVNHGQWAEALNCHQFSSYKSGQT